MWNEREKRETDYDFVLFPIDSIAKLSSGIDLVVFVYNLKEYVEKNDQQIVRMIALEMLVVLSRSFESLYRAKKTFETKQKQRLGKKIELNYANLNAFKIVD